MRARTPDSWQDVEEALAEGDTVRDADGDLIVRLDEHANGPDWRRCTYVSKRDEDGLMGADRSTYAQELASLDGWVVWSEPRVSDADVEAALASIAQVMTPVERSHLVDDHERQRTAGRRPLAEARDLLGDALHATRNKRTKTALDLVERALGKVNEAYAALDRKA